jgi:hypothetical protein
MVAALAVLLGPVAATLHAEDVRVTVMAIHATEHNKNMDDDLKAIAEKVQKKDARLTGFRKGRTTSMKVTVGGQEKSFPLVDGESATVKVDALLDGDKVTLVVKPPTLQSITYSAPLAKFFPIVTGYETKDKDRLIIAIMVETDK